MGKAIKKAVKFPDTFSPGQLLFGGKGKPVPKTLTMPLADDEAVKMARKRSISAQMARGGRSSTILTDDEDTLG